MDSWPRMSILARRRAPACFWTSRSPENAKDSTAYALYFGTYGPKLPKEAYADADKTAIYKRYLTNLLTYAGEAEDAAQKAGGSGHRFGDGHCEQ